MKKKLNQLIDIIIILDLLILNQTISRDSAIQEISKQLTALFLIVLIFVVPQVTATLRALSWTSSCTSLSQVSTHKT